MIALAVALSFAACAQAKIVRCKGPVKVQEFNELKNFNSIVVNGSADIFLTQEKHFGVSVRANEEVFKYLDFKVVNDVLYIETKDRANIIAETYDITISMPDIKALTVNGAGDVKVMDGFLVEGDLSVKVNGAGDLSIGDVEVEGLNVTVNGAGDVDIEKLNAKTIAVTVNGAGDVEVSGKADVAFFKVSGAGVIDARGLEAGSVETKRAGVAIIRLP